jgi:hypothetical protein
VPVDGSEPSPEPSPQPSVELLTTN